MSIALPSPRSVALQRMALLQQEVNQIKRDHGRPTEHVEEGRYEVEAIHGGRVRKGETEAAAVDAPAKKRAPRRGRSSESVGAPSAEPRTSGSKRGRRLPPPSGLAEPAKQSRRDDGGSEGGSEGGEDEEDCPADHLVLKYGQCGAPACYNNAASVRHSLQRRLPGTRGLGLGCSTRAGGASPLPLRTWSPAYGALLVPAVLRAATPSTHTPPPSCHLSPYRRASATCALCLPASSSLAPH